MSSQDARAIQPLLDTWEARKDNASWTLSLTTSQEGLSAAEGNAWFADALRGTFAVFDGLARPVSLVLEGPGILQAPGFPGLHLPRGDDRTADFLDQAEATIRTVPHAANYMRVAVELCAWVRTEASPHTPIRAWIRPPPTQFVWFGGPEEDHDAIVLSMSHTLFSPTIGSRINVNRELHLLNQPLLERALHVWHERFGGEIELDGRDANRYAYGFLSEETPELEGFEGD
jgi:hypothetical protein